MFTSDLSRPSRTYWFNGIAKGRNRKSRNIEEKDTESKRRRIYNLRHVEIGLQNGKSLYTLIQKLSYYKV